jgi:hypothetical protein
MLGRGPVLNKGGSVRPRRGPASPLAGFLMRPPRLSIRSLIAAIAILAIGLSYAARAWNHRCRELEARAAECEAFERSYRGCAERLLICAREHVPKMKPCGDCFLFVKCRTPPTAQIREYRWLTNFVAAEREKILAKLGKRAMPALAAERWRPGATAQGAERIESGG